MKLKRFKERDNKRKGIIVFTIACILLVSGVILYRTFAIFEVKTNQNVMNGQVQGIGDVSFNFYMDNKLTKQVPNKDTGYVFDSSKSYCEDGTIVLWNDSTWSLELGAIKARTKCHLYFNQLYKEALLNGAIPDLGNGKLIPVVILDGNSQSDVHSDGETQGGRVEKADITNTENPWYKYEDKKWANAILLKEGVEDTYAPGDEIPENNIESYFVWIPRYKYQLKEDEETYNKYTTAADKGTITNVSELYTNGSTNKGINGAFQIVFETKDKGTLSGNKKGDYITHPAFTAFNSNGFWVGKFETGYDGAATSADALKNEKNADKVIIKPNVYSWGNIEVANAFYTSYEYLRELESHMMKNTEWGAVAYLTQSKYGRCGSDNGNCTEVRINNSSSGVTGSSAVQEPTLGYNINRDYEGNGIGKDTSRVYNYNNSKSVISSTTNNYSGVYDLSGGKWEYVMGVLQFSENNSTPTSGANAVANSGFVGPYSNAQGQNTEGQPWPSSKYYDLYDYDTTWMEYQRGKLGDATKELGEFYVLTYNGSTLSRQVSSFFADTAYFASSTGPWFIRGEPAVGGTGAGIGAFHPEGGGAIGDRGFRIVLSL